MFQGKIVLGPIIGMVSRESAKIWILGTHDAERKQKPYCHLFHKEDNKGINGSPFEFKEITGIVYEYDGLSTMAYVAEIEFPAKGEEFEFQIRYSAEETGKGTMAYTLKRAPREDDTADFSFALISCHKALKKRKRDRKITEKMWGFFNRELEQKGTAFVIQCGDQVYCDNRHDNAWEKALASSIQGERLRLFRDIYMNSWDFPAVRRVLGTFPQYMIWDDHEIRNGWGSNFDDWDNLKPMFDAARQVYVEFQDGHNPAPLREGEFYYGFRHGKAAFLVLDLRGRRDVSRKEYPLAGQEQWQAVEEWLESEPVKESRVLFVVSSVPVVHLSRSLSALGFIKNDVGDQWSTPINKGERRLLLKLLLDKYMVDGRQAFILSGDSHVGTVASMTEEETGKKIHQISSSPITNSPSKFLDFFLQTFSSRFKFHLERGRKRRISAVVNRRYRERNFALIDVKYERGIPKVTLEMFEEDREEPELRYF